MLVVDTSAFISLAIGSVLDPTVDEFEVTTTETVVSELADTAEYDDRHGTGARAVLDRTDDIDVVDVDGNPFNTSRIDAGEASCVAAARSVDAAFLITDDYRALPEIRELVTADVALSPIVCRALVKRGVLDEQEARDAFDQLADDRDWLGAPIHRYAEQLFE